MKDEKLEQMLLDAVAEVRTWPEWMMSADLREALKKERTSAPQKVEVDRIPD